MIVQDLLEIAEELQMRSQSEPELLEKEVRFASQPNHPFEYSIEDNHGELPETDDAVYFSEGAQIGYLPGEVSDQLSW